MREKIINFKFYCMKNNHLGSDEIRKSFVNDVKNIINSVSSQKDALKSTANELKNLFKF